MWAFFFTFLTSFSLKNINDFAAARVLIKIKKYE